MPADRAWLRRLALSWLPPGLVCPLRNAGDHSTPHRRCQALFLRLTAVIDLDKSDASRLKTPRGQRQERPRGRFAWLRRWQEYRSAGARLSILSAASKRTDEDQNFSVT